MGTAIKRFNQNTDLVETAAGRWGWLYTLSGTAALLAGALFLAAAAGFVAGRLAPGAPLGQVWPFRSDWLIVLFELHAGLAGTQSGQLQGLDQADIAILALVAITYLGLYAALRKSSRIWSIVALAQALLAPVLFVATQSAGRSGVMGAGLVASVVMLRGKAFGKATALLGIAASVCLLLSDFSVGLTQSKIIAGLTGLGYGLLIAWLFLVAWRLFQLGWAGHGSAK
jgi:hypothetical protein